MLTPFSLSLEKVGTITIVEGPACSICRTPVLQDLETHAPCVDSPNGTSFIEGTASTAVTRNDFVFVYGLGADVEADHHKQNIRYRET